MNDQFMQLLGRLAEQSVDCALQIAWRTAAITGSGERRSTRVSVGAPGEFAGWRPYIPGQDPARFIDFAATARTGKPDVLLVRQSFETRDIPVVAIVDQKASMCFGSETKLKRMLALELANSVVRSAGRSQDSAALIAYDSEHILAHVSPRSHRKVMAPALRQIIDPPGHLNRQANSRSTFRRALELLPVRRSLVFIASDFFGLTDEDLDAMRNAAARHDLIALLVQDPREAELPRTTLPWLLTLTDIGTGKRKMLCLPFGRAKYAAAYEQHVQRISEAVRNLGGGFGIFKTTDDLITTRQALFRALGGRQ